MKWTRLPEGAPEVVTCLIRSRLDGAVRLGEPTGGLDQVARSLKHGNCKKFLLDSHLALTIVDIRSIQKKIESQLLLVVMNINTMTFVAPNLACGKARGGSIPRSWVCNRRATQPQTKFGATRRAAVLFRPDFVARYSQIHCGICSSRAPCPHRKSLAANVSVFMN